jgi:choline dehydrogenase-like flavoprotein
MVNTTVSKIILKKSKGSIIATGVEVNGSKIKARKEVIVSAGTFLSPRLLKLTGIGQKSVLSGAGIDTILELERVGENLQDHVRIQSSYILKDSYTSFDELRTNTTYAAQQLSLWEAGKRSADDYTRSGYAFMPGSKRWAIIRSWSTWPKAPQIQTTPLTNVSSPTSPIACSQSKCHL